jgi:hypothetical protein
MEVTHVGDKSRLELKCIFTLALFECAKFGEQIKKKNGITYTNINNNLIKIIRFAFPNVQSQKSPCLFLFLLFCFLDLNKAGTK